MAGLDQPTAKFVDAEAFWRLVDLGAALSSERNHDRLLERILLGAKDITNADGGTLYLMQDGDKLSFKILRNDTLKIAMGGTTGRPIAFPPLKLYRDDGTANHNQVATHVALTGETVVIEDAYNVANFDFSGTKAFDQKTGYRSKSFLTVPLKNRKQEVIAVLQMINARPLGSDVVISFDSDTIPLVEALASQAAVAIENQQLIEAQKNLFNSFIQLMAAAIDAKSAYTGGHCQRVPALTEMLARAACECKDGEFADFELNEDQWYELAVAGGLHDVGKVVTPIHIMDKSTKLEKICDRIDDVRTRIEVLKRDAELAAWKDIAEQRLEGAARAERLERAEAEVKQYDDDFAFLRECNIGGEFMADEKIERLKAIGGNRMQLGGEERPLLDYDEVMNLSIRRGTLNDEDRKIINDHIVQTIHMLESLPFPKHLKNVAEIAGGHHEKMDGTGYPRRLKRHEMSWLARMMGIADIFEALTAADRPYKKAKTLSESMKIMGFMKRDHHIDPDLFDLFVTSGCYKKYAERFLLPEQIDEVNEAALIAIKPPPLPWDSEGEGTKRASA